MKAAVCTEYGPPDVVSIQEVPRPVPGPDQVLVQVRATTVNRTDSGTRSGKPLFARAFTGLRRPSASILGCEYAGDIVEVGADVAGLSVGDRIFGYNEGPFGAHAEYLAVAADGPLAPIPDGVDYAAAAAGTEGSHYAWSFMRKARVRAGQRVLVNGATGGIGSAAVQLLRSLDIEVVAVCAGEHAELVRGLGASRVIDYTSEDFTADPERFDAVFDAVGKSSFGACRPLLQPDGIYCATELGPKSENIWRSLVSPFQRGRRVIFPYPSIDAALVQRFATMMAAGSFRPVIDRSYPLDEIVDAYRYVETGQKIGNVVIAPVATG